MTETHGALARLRRAARPASPRLVLRFGLVSALVIALLISATGVVASRLIASQTQHTAARLTAVDIRFIEGLALKQISTAAQASSQDQLRDTFATVTGSGDFVAITAYVTGTGTVLFSDDPAGTGATQPLTAGLKKAGDGVATSAFVDKGAAGRDGRLAAKFGRLLVVYVPVEISGVRLATVALYLRWAPYAASIHHDLLILAGTLLVGGILLFLLLFRLFATASRRLRRESERNAVMATHDSLTGLWNRPGLSAATEILLRDPVALMLVDLNRFKDVNDTLGHRRGDLLLTSVAHRMQGLIVGHGEVGRIGGDEFVVVVRDPERAVLIADLILDELHRGFEIEGELMDVDASVGIAVSPDHGDDFDLLLQHADVAMYAAKASGGGWFRYDPDADPNTPERLTLVGDLRRAVASDEFELRYQPIVALDGSSQLAAEALVRWLHPTRGLLAPDAFMALAEETGLVRQLTSIVLREAIGQARRWHDQGLAVHVSVNVSARCVLDEHLVDEVSELLRTVGLPGDRLTIELTESGVLHDPGRARRVLSGLAALHVGLSLDDFGTGHSSLAHLQQLPLTEVKIDRSFVKDVAGSRRDAAIVGACVQLASSLGLRTVAEGVEDAAAMASVRALGATSVQGWHLCRAVPADEATAWFASAATPLGSVSLAVPAQVAGA